MRTTSPAIAAALAGILMAGTAIADSTVPGDPGVARRDPGPASAPDLTPTPGGARPTERASALYLKFDLSGPTPSTPAAGDAAVDQLLGVLPGNDAAAEGAKHIYVTEDGDLGCVTLDTFWPEDC